MSTVLQGKYENGEAHVAVKGSAKETAVLLSELIQKLAQGLNMSYEDTVRYINSSRRRNRDDIFERDDDSESYSSREELAKFFRRETNPVRERKEPVQEEKRQGPVRQTIEAAHETYEEPVSVQREDPLTFKLHTGVEGLGVGGRLHGGVAHTLDTLQKVFGICAKNLVSFHHHHFGVILDGTDFIFRQALSTVKT